MSNFSAIFRLRSQLDPLRQAGIKNEFETLKGSLRPGQTPYDYIPEIRNALMSIGYFSIGATGRQVEPPRCAHLYRLTSLTKVRTYTNWKRDSELPLQLALEQLIVRSQESSDSAGWFPLSAVAEGELTSDRHFTWWSSYPLHKESIICDLHLRGMPNDWISPYSLLLRCSVNYLNKNPLLFTPSALDGFDSAIFDASDDLGGATCGRAISIENPDELQHGADEFVLKPVPVKAIEILPLMITEAMRGHKVNLIDIIPSLAVFYERGLHACLYT